LAAAQSQDRPDESKTGYRDPSIIPDSLVAPKLQRLQSEFRLNHLHQWFVSAV